MRISSILGLLDGPGIEDLLGLILVRVTLERETSRLGLLVVRSGHDPGRLVVAAWAVSPCITLHLEYFSS
jgi:hypothetical protein